MTERITIPPIFQGGGKTIAAAETLDSLRFPLPDASLWLTDNPHEIAARQEVFRDLINDPQLENTFAEAKTKLDALADLVRKSGGFLPKDSESALYALRELSVFTDAVTALAEAGPVRSGRLGAFFSAVKAIALDADFAALRDWLDTLADSLRNIRSLTLGVNLDAQLGATEAGIVSINSKPFMAGNFVERGLRKEAADEGYSLLGVIGIRENGTFLGPDKLVVDRAFYTAMNEIVRGSLRNLRRRITSDFADVMRSLLARADEIGHLLSCASLLRRMKEAKLPLTFPETGVETKLLRLYSVALTDKLPVSRIVPSDVRMTDEERIFILTGPNAGGKTVYCTALGIAQLLYQLGLPVPARSAIMQTFARIAVHFTRDTAGSTESRLADEAARLREALDGADSGTLLLLDETFSSTSAFDALYLAEAMIDWLLAAGCRALYSTHLHELTAKYGGGAVPGVDCLSAKVEDGRRTYEIVPRTDEDPATSLAKDIAVENGLGFLFGN